MDLAQQPRLKTRTFHNDVWSSADGREWICNLAEGKAPWPGRSYHDTATWDGKLWVLGGHRGVADHPDEVATDGNRNDVWYSADGEHWQELPPHNLAVALHLSRLIDPLSIVGTISTDGLYPVVSLLEQRGHPEYRPGLGDWSILRRRSRQYSHRLPGAACAMPCSWAAFSNAQMTDMDADPGAVDEQIHRPMGGKPVELM